MRGYLPQTPLPHNVQCQRSNPNGLHDQVLTRIRLSQFVGAALVLLVRLYGFNGGRLLPVFVLAAAMLSVVVFQVCAEELLSEIGGCPHIL